MVDAQASSIRRLCCLLFCSVLSQCLARWPGNGMLTVSGNLCDACAPAPVHHCSPGASVPGALAEQWMKGSKRQDWFLKAQKGIFSKIIELGQLTLEVLGDCFGLVSRAPTSWWLVAENCSKLWILPQILTVVHSVSNNSNNGKHLLSISCALSTVLWTLWGSYN